jgi:hypothetical protein
MKDRLLSPARTTRTVLFGVFVLSAVASSVAQGKLVDRRDQAEGWYLPVQGQVMAGGKTVTDCSIELYQDNKLLGPVALKKSGKFEVNMDIDNTYIIIVRKEGYESKMIYVDTSLPEDLVTYPDYVCFVNLVPKAAKTEANFYHDFPSAIVRWNPEMEGFYHSENYLSHIQSKFGNMASATF